MCHRTDKCADADVVLYTYSFHQQHTQRCRVEQNSMRKRSNWFREIVLYYNIGRVNSHDGTNGCVYVCV